jgi:DNA ligase (NAD+)
VGKVLANRYGSLEALLQATEEELQEIGDIGATMAKSIVNFFRDKANLAFWTNYKRPVVQNDCRPDRNFPGP